MSKPIVQVRRSKKQERAYKRTVNIYVDGKLRVKVSWCNGSPHLIWKKQ